jgi:hypothetical protein
MGGPQLALLLLAICLSGRLLPADGRRVLVLVTLLALPLAARLAARWSRAAIALLGALLSATALCALALLSPELWLQTSLAAALVLGGGLALGGLPPRALAVAFSLGGLAPLVLGTVIALSGAGSRTLVLGGLGEWSIDFVSLKHLADWLAFSLALLLALQPAAGSSARWPSALALSVLAVLLTLRLAWLATTLSLPTDLMIWSEPPLLLNLWKLRAGEVFYGPLTRLSSYSYSPALEHLQYGLLRPFGLELSLRAHRALGVLWQLLAAACLTSAATRWLGRGRSSRWAVALASAGCVFSSLLAPHLHPDHLLMLCLCAAFWLVTRAERPRGARIGLLVALPVLATTFKLTGAGLGLGLGLVYLWERDGRALGWLVLSGLLALATIPLFDSTLGNFSEYAIRLQASHPFDVARTLAVPTTPPLLLLCVALAVTAVRWRASQGAPAARAALRVCLLTFGMGLTSMLAYAKHGGRDNSLLPFTLGGALALVIALCDSPGVQGEAGRAERPLLCSVLAAALALATPTALPVTGRARVELQQMHETAVTWLRQCARARRRVFSVSTAAYLDAGWREVPDTSLSTVSELALAARPEVVPFQRRMRDGYYDGLLLTASSLRVNPTLVALLPALRKRYVVVQPPELRGAWPSGLTGYVIAERPAHDIR